MAKTPATIRRNLVADLRTRIPRHVGVFGPVEQANQAATHLHHAGLPVTLYADGPVQAHEGVDVEGWTPSASIWLAA